MLPEEPTPESIERTLRLGEDSRNEFKSVVRRRPQADDLAAAIVSFANSGGGRLWLGVDADSTPSGVGDRASADDLLTLLDDVCQHNVEPPIACRHVKVEYGAVALLVTEVPGFAPGRPYRTSGGKYYVRGGASRRLASGDEVRRLVQSAAASALVPDELPVPGTSLDDLDSTRFREFHRLAYGDEPPTDAEALRRLLTALKILTTEGLSLMGVLCFARDPQRPLPWARVSAARSPGVDVGMEFLDRKEIGGTLDAQITGTERFILDHLRSPSRIEGFESEAPEPSLPLEAIREVVRNAIAHRDYAIRSPILVTVYDDRLEVSSPGRLLNSVSVEAVRLGVHVERNPLLAGVLAKRGMMTERGSGVPRVLRIMREQSLPEPEIEERGPSLLVALRTKPASR